MTTYSFGDVILIGFPHTNLQNISKRPAIILYDSGDKDVLAARITAQEHKTKTDHKIIKMERMWSSYRILHQAWKAGNHREEIHYKKVRRIGSFRDTKTKDDSENNVFIVNGYRILKLSIFNHQSKIVFSAKSIFALSYTSCLIYLTSFPVTLRVNYY